MDAFDQYVRGGLERAGVEVDATELEIMRFVDAVYGPELAALATADLRGAWPELDLDLTRAPSS